MKLIITRKQWLKSIAFCILLSWKPPFRTTTICEYENNLFVCNYNLWVFFQLHSNLYIYMVFIPLLNLHFKCTSKIKWTWKYYTGKSYFHPCFTVFFVLNKQWFNALRRFSRFLSWSASSKLTDNWLTMIFLFSDWWYSMRDTSFAFIMNWG